jgi:hypothetical protein
VNCGYYLLLAYLALGAVFIAWQSRRWWYELERAACTFMAEHEAAPRWVVIASMAVLAGLSLVLDLLLWPRCALRAWASRGRRDP